MRALVVRSMAHVGAEICRNWDDDQSIRKRVRDHARLLMVAGPDGTEQAIPFEEVVTKNVGNARVNKKVLRTIMVFMSTNNYKLPPIDTLLIAVGQFFELSKLTKSSTAIYQEAWGVRRLCQLVKSRLYKASPPKDIPGLYS